MEPPDPIPNSEVKRVIADDSVGSPHVKVGHYQDLTPKPRYYTYLGFFFIWVVIDTNVSNYCSCLDNI